MRSVMHLTLINHQAANNFLAFQVSVLYVTRPILIGVNFSVSWIAYIFACIAAAMICYRFKKLKLVASAGFMFFTLFYICMATTTLNSNRSVWGFPVFFGVGLAFGLNALIAAAQFSAPPDLM